MRKVLAACLAAGSWMVLVAGCASSPDPAPSSKTETVIKDVKISKPQVGDKTPYAGNCSCQYYVCDVTGTDCWWGDSWPCDCDSGDPIRQGGQGN